LALHSEQFTIANSYNFRQATVTNNTTETNAPDGTTNADKIFPDSSINLHQIFSNNTPNTISFTSGTTYTQTVFAKLGNGSQGQRLQMLFSSGRFTLQPYANFNLQSGTITATGGSGTASITALTNGWYRCSLTATCNSTGVGGGVFMGLITTDTAVREESFEGIISHFIYAWGAQVETGSVPTSYIPTTTAAITRAADVITKTGVSSLIGQTEGTIYAELDFRTFPQAGSPIVAIVTLNVGANNLHNCIVLGVERLSGGTNRFYSFVQVSNATQAGLIGSTLTNGIYKVALTYKQNDFAMYVNGASVATDNSGNVPTCSEVLIGNRFNTDTVFLNDRIRAAAIYPNRLSNPELIALTTP
jgi:hypothetical protein